MTVTTRGFIGRERRDDIELPAGQYLTPDFPVLSAGPTPRIATADWEFSIEIGDTLHSWSWDELHAVGLEDVSTDIHCVTRWSKLDTNWRGVSLDALFDGLHVTDRYVMAYSYGGYTTNMPLADLLGGRAWIATEYEGAPLTPEHGGPARLIVPHLYFWKSAKWVRGLRMQADDLPGFWEENGYHLRGDPWHEERYSS